jgi:hypothetical protein
VAIERIPDGSTVTEGNAYLFADLLHVVDHTLYPRGTETIVVILEFVACLARGEIAIELKGPPSDIEAEVLSAAGGTAAITNGCLESPLAHVAKGSESVGYHINYDITGSGGRG